jgi:alanine racemase
VSALPRELVRVGEPVEAIGPTVTLDEVAAAAGTISYEILTRLSARLAREYRGT